MPKKSKYENVKCSVQHCKNQARVKGLCLRHYKRFMYCGSTKVSRPCYHEPPEKKFWRYVDKDCVNGCWEWTGYKDKNGYGNIKVSGSPQRAHRFSYEMHTGKIQEGLLVLHNCDNPSCVNPDHLRCGTHKENMEDRLLSGNYPTGENHPNSKISNEDTIKIRVANGTREEIAGMFGISPTQVGNIRRGEQRQSIVYAEQEKQTT